MEFALTVFNQVLVMFVLMFVGFVAFKAKLCTQEGKKELTNILLYIVTPMVIINAYQTEFNAQLVQNLLIAFALAIASHIIGIAVSHIFIRGKGDPDIAIARFAITYSNCGFMALPLISALFGGTGVFYASAYITVFNFLSWTHGYIMMSGVKDKSVLKKVATTPAVIAIVIGLICFFARITLPNAIGQAVSFLGSMNTPMAMIITGVSLAQSNLKEAFSSAKNYYVVFLINLMVPLCAMAIYIFLPINSELVLINLIATACPTATATLLFATSLQKNETYATQLLTLSNLASIITIPLVIYLYQTLSVLV